MQALTLSASHIIKPPVQSRLCSRKCKSASKIRSPGTGTEASHNFSTKNVQLHHLRARHERRLLAREAAQRQRRQEEQDRQASSHVPAEANMLSRSEDDQVSTMMMARASTLASAATFETSDAFPSLSNTFSSTTSIVYSDVPSSVARDVGSSSYRGHYQPQSSHAVLHPQPQSYTKGSTLLLAASAAATSAWALSRIAPTSRPVHSPFVNATLKAAARTTTAATTSGGTRQVALLAGACMAAGGHCCPISSPFRAGAGLPVAVKMSVLGAMSFLVGGRYASRVHQQQHY